MTITLDRSHPSANMATLEDRFHVMKEIGDGSFGSVALARVRTAGSSIAKRGTMVAIKTMKKTYNSYSQCLELREVIFLRSLPQHVHLVPALDIFLDPLSKKLHICMEYMDGNLYQLMKARDHKYLDSKSVKSILYQILSGLDHIHAHNFFHRDIKPENILVSSAAPIESSGFSRYSNLVTPPATPTSYTVKIADFGLARETHSKHPYTNYVSTRWYRAPEVLLRAGYYSAPVDMWAVGAMAVEIATLKPLFPGGNEVDQVWRICEIMGSPGNWYSKTGSKVGGGEWRDGIKLAQKLGFSFPKMAPHSLESVLPPNHWPASLSHFVTWCLMWDPKQRPTSAQALNHEYFADAVDPLRPKSSASRLIGRRQSDKSFKSNNPSDSPSLSSKHSWFRRSLIGGRESPAPVIENIPAADAQASKVRPALKRATWANGAPMPILPSIRPVSPLSNAVTAQAKSSVTYADNNNSPAKQGKSTSKKIGRQLSVNSNGNHYTDAHRQETERILNGGLTSPSTVQKESFFSHLRKRARRLSGRNQNSVPQDDVEASAAGSTYSNRSSLAMESNNPVAAKQDTDFSELDKALQNVKYNMEQSANGKHQPTSNPTTVKNHLPVQHPSTSVTPVGSISGRTRRTMHRNAGIHRYETPEEEDELLHEVLHSTAMAASHLVQQSMEVQPSQTSQPLQHKNSAAQSIRAVGNDCSMANPYPTPSPTAKRDGYGFMPDMTLSNPMRMNKPQDFAPDRQWPTPPYDDNQWADNTATSIFPAGSMFRT